MENPEKIEALRNLFEDVSVKLSRELHNPLPDTMVLKDLRKQLSQIDKDISRLQRQREGTFNQN